MMLRFLQRKEEAFITPKSIKLMEVKPSINTKKGSETFFWQAWQTDKPLDDNSRSSTWPIL